jgi:hypothetical protein
MKTTYPFVLSLYDNFATNEIKNNHPAKLPLMPEQKIIVLKFIFQPEKYD